MWSAPKGLKKDPAGYEVTGVEGPGSTTDTYFIDKSGYAIVTPSKDVAIQFTKKLNAL